MNRFYLIIIIRVILITLNGLAMAYFYLKVDTYPATTLFFLILLFIQTYSLIYYANKTNRDLANFLISLQDNDTTLAFPRTRLDKNFRGLTDNLNKIILKIQQARIEKEQKHQFLQTVIDHIGIGLISFYTNGDIEFINKTAKKTLGITAIKNINSLGEKHAELLKYFSDVYKEDQGLIKINLENREIPLSIKTSEIRFNDNSIKIISFQDIQYELEAQELESWRKLIRILRHEIMNSITPITTLTTAIKRNLNWKGTRKPLNEINEENINDILLSADVIEERGKGLISFVERFKKLTELPKPKHIVFNIEKMFESIRKLFLDELIAKNITCTIDVQKDTLQIDADEQLIEQVLINLVKNSIEAIKHDNGIIVLSANKRPAGNIVIQVKDNGHGIKQEDIDNIFVPSYSTKENGTGIGLSISKQIIQAHHGTISVKSIPGKETVFELVL
jgi:two-component system, NtrC family, nitrogen regulation sensor histidine kinase NtrY